MRRVFGSFRDPSGYVYEDDSQIFRSVSKEHAPHYTHFVESGLRDELWLRGQLIPYEDAPLISIPGAWKVLAAERVGFFSYPYEWSFSQLQDAALLMLDIQIESLKRGLILKDASAYNVTFNKGVPVFIDLLSFEIWCEGQPWQGYQQFCKHFLAPLSLMSKTDVRLHHLLRIFIDGIPLDLASKLLPKRSYLSIHSLLHIHAHALAQRKYNDNSVSAVKARSVKVTREHLIGIAEQLRGAVNKLAPFSGKSTWSDYYDECDYRNETAAEKLRIVRKTVEDLRPLSVVDLGGNDGFYSRAISEFSALVVSTDFDQNAVDKNYRMCRSQKLRNVIPLVLDLSNPSGGLGWAGKERASFQNRSNFDIAMGLALIHHLVISMNIPLTMVAEAFAILGRYALVEFVPPDDTQVLRIAAMRPGSLDRYSHDEFMAAFSARFYHQESHSLPYSGRTLHLFERK